jgi:hypothetical protein
MLVLSGVVLPARERSIHICTCQTSQLTVGPGALVLDVSFRSLQVKRVQRAGCGVGVDEVVR